MINKVKKQPLISVIMPVYNAGGFLVEAIESILNQTYENFELIIINDESTDGSEATILRFAKKDRRIKIISNEKNLGLAASLIKGLKIAKGSYIARMDADDVAVNTRLEKQLSYLEKKEKLVAVGSQVKIINKKGETIGKKNLPLTSEKIHGYIFHFNPIQHPTLMIKKSRLPKDFVYYNPRLDGAEDLDLIFKLFQYGKVENMKEYLLKYRIHGNNMSLKNVKSIFLQAFMTRMNALFKYSYRPPIYGLMVTLIEATIVLILPQKILLWLYFKVRMKISKKAIPAGRKIFAFRLKPAVS